MLLIEADFAPRQRAAIDVHGPVGGTVGNPEEGTDEPTVRHEVIAELQGRAAEILCQRGGIVRGEFVRENLKVDTSIFP